MARTNILDTRTQDFGEFIGNGKTYRVPPYQRDYSWTVEQWDDLWTDILELRSKPGEIHYMGAIVVQSSADREFSIIDGQQRTATLSILALAIIARLETLAETGNDPAANRERALELRRGFVGERDPASLTESSKLFLNEIDDPFYQDYLVQLRRPLNPRRLPKSNRLLWECFVYFEGQIDTLQEICDDGVALARLLHETISRQLLFIVIAVEDEVNAYTVFETLNARGLELTTADLLKNYLFSKVRAVSDLTALRRRWRSLMTIVTPERFPEFLRYHMQTDSDLRVRSQRLFKFVRDQSRTPEEVFNLLSALERRAELFAALMDDTHEYWAELPSARVHIRELSLFRGRQMTPLLFAAHEALPPAQFVSVLRAVAVLTFRYTIVAGLNTNALEPVYQAAARAVRTGRAATPAAIAALLRPVYVQDEKFEQDMSLLVVETSGQQRRLTKYILGRLEADASGRPVDPLTDPASIEHVLPENPGAGWDDVFSVEQQEALVYRLGNLTLLEATLNREVGNAPYAEKVAAYGRSAYTLTRSIIERAPTEWTAELIAERQLRMAKRAVHLWRIDF